MNLRFQKPSDFLDKWLKHWSKELDANDRRIFEKYYTSYVKHFGPYIKNKFDEVMSDIIKEINYRLLNNKTIYILDVGCGLGTESLYYSLLGCKVAGVDLNTHYLRVAKTRKHLLENKFGINLQCVFRKTSVFQLDKNVEYDIIWMSQTFHHVEPRNEFVPLLTSLLKPDGAIIINESNAWNPLLQIKTFMGRGFNIKRNFIDEDGYHHQCAHERFLSAFKMSRLFKKYGIYPAKIKHFRIFPNFTACPKFMKSFDRVVPQFFIPVFTNFTYVGYRKYFQ